jgi:hypothetical protein
VKFRRIFGTKYQLRLQGLRISKQETSMKQAALFSGFLFGLLFDPAYGGDMFLRNTSLDFRGAIQRYVPQDRTLHSHTTGILKSNKALITFTEECYDKVFFETNEIFLEDEFLTKVLDRGDWSVSRSDRFIFREGALVPVIWEAMWDSGLVWTR